MTCMVEQDRFRAAGPELIAEALAAAEDAVVITEATPFGPNPNPRVVYVNAGFTRMTGYEPHEIIGRSPRLCQGADTSRIVLDRIRSALERWEPVCERVLNYRKDGTPFWVELRIRPVARPDGWITHWISIQRDVTQQQQEQERASRTLQELGDACLRARLGTWRWALGTTLTLDCVPDALLSLPMTGNEARISEIVAAIAAQHRRLVARQVQRVISRGDTVTLEFTIMAADGTARSIWAQARPERSDDGEIQAVFGIWQDITEQRCKAELELWSATHDPLTRLPNREVLLESAADLARNARDAGRTAALVVLAVDRLDSLNEVYGPWIGDLAVQEVAGRLRRQASRSRPVARFGSGQFLMLGQYRDRADIDDQVATLLARLRTTFGVSGEVLDLSVSAGIACFDGPEALVSDIVRNAHIALIEARRTGTGGFSHFRDDMRAKAQLRVAHLARARESLESGRIVPFYQPKVRLSDGALIGFEALLRVAEGDRFLPPSEVWQAFNDPHLARAMGRVMTHKVMQQIASWNRSRLPFGAIALNVSSHELEVPDFSAQLLAGMRDHGIAAEQFQVEVTEDAVIGGPDTRVTDQLWALKHAGLRVALDDFGTGYASLTHLRSLPVNTLKIDRSFVTNVCANPADAAIVEGIARIGRALGLKVIAEGVETFAQARSVGQLGCHVMQGYLGGHPMSGADAAQLVRGWAGHRRRLQGALCDVAARPGPMPPPELAAAG